MLERKGRLENLAYQFRTNITSPITDRRVELAERITRKRGEPNFWGVCQVRPYRRATARREAIYGKLMLRARLADLEAVTGGSQYL